jgi:hypothetical protein
MGRIQRYLAGERQARRSALRPKSPSTVFGCLAMTQSVTLRKRGRNRVCVLSFQPAEGLIELHHLVDGVKETARRRVPSTRTTINVSRPMYALKATRLLRAINCSNPPIESSKVSLCRRISRSADPVSQSTRASTSE